MPDIDFIYFDLGKVILDFDHQLGCRQIAELSELTPESVRRAIFDTGLAVKYETGLINCEQFHAAFCRSTDSRIGQDELLTALSDVFEPNRKIFPLITQLRAVNFPIGILSNTCRAHWDFVYRRYTILRELFEPVILSYEVASMKPNSKIYARAIERAGCGIGKCFFVDDLQQNVDAANAAGMDAVLYQSTDALVQALVDRGVMINL